VHQTTDYLILGAMEAEVAEVLRHAVLLRTDAWCGFDFHHVLLFGKNCIVVKCGVGKVFAAMVTQHGIDAYSPSAVVFSGVAGALSPVLDIGDVIVSRDLVQHDVDGRALGFVRGQLLYTDLKIFTADPALVAKAMSTNLEGPTLHLGRILSGDQFMTRHDIEAHHHLTEEMGGDAVEMEGAALAQVCHLNQVPYVVIRSISDKADGEAVKDFSAFLPVVARNSYAVLRTLMTG
jgi:adenosylhomocysteine nucleosidase